MKKNSFVIALEELSRDSIGERGVKAIKVCKAADDLLRACKKAKKIIDFAAPEFTFCRALISKAILKAEGKL